MDETINVVDETGDASANVEDPSDKEKKQALILSPEVARATFKLLRLLESTRQRIPPQVLPPGFELSGKVLKLEAYRIDNVPQNREQYRGGLSVGENKYRVEVDMQPDTSIAGALLVHRENDPDITPQQAVWVLEAMSEPYGEQQQSA